MLGRTGAGLVSGDGRSIESGEGDLTTAKRFIEGRALAENGGDFTSQSRAVCDQVGGVDLRRVHDAFTVA